MLFWTTRCHHQSIDMSIWSIMFIQSYFVVLWPPLCLMVETTDHHDVSSFWWMPHPRWPHALHPCRWQCQAWLIVRFVESHWVQRSRRKGREDWLVLWSSWCVKEASVRENTLVWTRLDHDGPRSNQSISLACLTTASSAFHLLFVPLSVQESLIASSTMVQTSWTLWPVVYTIRGWIYLNISYMRSESLSTRAYTRST